MSQNRSTSHLLKTGKNDIRRAPVSHRSFSFVVSPIPDVPLRNPNFHSKNIPFSLKLTPKKFSSLFWD